MDINEVLCIFDQLYLLFDEHFVQRTKNVNNYESIFQKKEIIELIKINSNVTVKNKKEIKTKDEIIDELIFAFKNIDNYFQKCDIFSKNEIVDDINTKYLRILLIPYILGYLNNETENMDLRYERLIDSKLYFNEFMSTVHIYKIIKVDDYLFDEDNENDVFQRRNIKIKRAKEEQNFQETLNLLLKKNIRHSEKDKRNENTDDTTEENREMYLALIKMKFIQTLNAVDLLDTELKLLEMRRQKEQEMEKGKENIKGATIVDLKKEEPVKKPWLFPIKNNMKLCDVSQIRKYYKDSVFKPFHNLPTITLEECAKIEMQYALNGVSDKNENISDSEQEMIKHEKNDDYYKQCLKKEKETDLFHKEWDDWKDLHQKGIGNKNRNVA